MAVRILIVNANTMEAMSAGIQEEASAAAAAGVQIVTVTPEMGPSTVEGFYDAQLAVPGILKEIIRHEAEFDAFVIAGWGDPGVEAAREISNKPVVGIGEASMYVCNMIAARWAVVTVLPRIKVLVEKTILNTGFALGPGQRCIGVYTSDVTVAETNQDPGRVVARLEAAGRQAMQDGAEAIALGCAGMVGLDASLEARLGIPVVDSVRAAVRLIETVIGVGKATSKVLTYKQPETKRIVGYEALYESVRQSGTTSEQSPEKRRIGGDR